MADQRSRSDLLKALGFDSYEAYLKSDLWRDVRGKVFMAKGRKCFCCGRKASYVHHTSYSIATLRGNDRAILANAWPICGRCHKRVHFSRSGEFRRLKAARDSFFQRKKNANVKPKRNGRKRLKILAEMRRDAAFHARMCD